MRRLSLPHLLKLLLPLKINAVVFWNRTRKGYRQNAFSRRGVRGKAAVQLEVIAYLASKAVGGRPVKLFNTREEDMITSPVHIGLDAIVKLGAAKDGILKAADIQLFI